MRTPRDAEVGRVWSHAGRRPGSALAHIYLERVEHGDGWMLHGDELEGRLEWADGSERGLAYDVIVDGRRLSWEEFGQALGPFEGFRIRLVVSDLIEELDR